MIVAGVDIGNQTTEVAIARIAPGQVPQFLSHALAQTTGIKGTPPTAAGVRIALEEAASAAGLTIGDIELVRINEAAPVVAGVAMQAITETILTDSTLVGHNPETPGGVGLGAGITLAVSELHSGLGAVIAVVPGSVKFDEAALLIRNALESGVQVIGVIVQADDGVLIANRIGRSIPVVDEVNAIERIPLGQQAAIEVAPIGATIQTLCNPYGLATLFELDPATTARIAPAARALTGLRSAVVIRTPAGAIVERRIKPGRLTLHGRNVNRPIDLRSGAAAIMSEVARIGPLSDVQAQAGTSAGAMFGILRRELAAAAEGSPSEIRVRDLLAADLSVPQPVAGGLSNEVAPERAVALAAMVETGAGFSAPLGEALRRDLGVPIEAGGLEADAGVRGALTTPGAGLPLCAVDLGSGSTNAARMAIDGKIDRVHLAGGGAMVNLLLGEELGIADAGWREDLKRHRVARVESLFSIRHESGAIEFLEEPVPVTLFGRTVVLASDGLRAVPGNPSIERIMSTPRRAQPAGLGMNNDRARNQRAPGGNPRFLGFVVLIGGSALDFELPGMLAEQLSEYGIVIGTANTRGLLGPRNAVATGLVMDTKSP